VFSRTRAYSFKNLQSESIRKKERFESDSVLSQMEQPQLREASFAKAPVNNALPKNRFKKSVRQLRECETALEDTGQIHSNTRILFRNRHAHSQSLTILP